ncbi:MAG: protein-glutamate O-methyltransferase CheR [Arcobacter sp.]|nr:protein-glutamate O-methyltransferase CheR [Arcobacter sp.]
MIPIIIETAIIINDNEFRKLKELIYKHSGLFIENDKKEFLQNKLSSHAKKLKLESFTKYYYKILEDENEFQIMINKITTNQTYFFREQIHFDFLKYEILENLDSKRVFKCWSAASSTGEEAYSCSMVIANDLDTKNHRWEVVLSDINNEVLRKAKIAKYDLKEEKKIPTDFFNKYCELKKEDNKHFYIKKDLKRSIIYKHINLTKKLPQDLEQFDVIFLRNVIIYFDKETRKNIVENIISRLKKGGYLFMGHSESLFNITSKVKLIKPSIYKKL